MKQRFDFKKEERLISRKAMDALFREKTSSVFQYPIKFTWLPYPLDQDIPAQVLISVSKRRFKAASSRNRIKRILREVYRKNKHQLYDVLTSKNQSMLFLLSYVGEKEVKSADVERIFLSIVKKFQEAQTKS